jgi:recombination protein RecA
LAPSASYFVQGSDKERLDFFSSGCALLDSVLGGGYVLGRITNVVGDKSTGKTLLAIEGAVNFLQTYPDGLVRYAEAEAAFDEDYASALGMPVKQVSFSKEGEMGTVEQFFEDVTATLDSLKPNQPAFYVLDSLDSLSDAAEVARGISDASYGGSKAKKLSEAFRKLVRRIEASRMSMLIISQIRDNIGVTFGAKYSRSGGHALDFYASQIFWLHEAGKIKRTVSGVERVVGLDIKARCTKNKVGLPFRDCTFPVLFGYGIDDISATVEWLSKSKLESVLQEAGMEGRSASMWAAKIRDGDPAVAREVRKKLAVALQQEWQRIETSFLPKVSKY